jgi:6-pyruvoyltetrahydropterin/6-carboxytetrahydropterin synthase
MLTLKRIETFCASHRLFNPQWSDEKNAQIYGKCAHTHGHGHNYKMEVCISGPINPQNGMIFNLQELKEIIANKILNDVDHKHLNFDVPWLQGKIPTTEVLVQCVWERLQDHFNSLQTNAKLTSVTIWETEKNVVTKTLSVS